jgi:hypothetical protein
MRGEVPLHAKHSCAARQELATPTQFSTHAKSAGPFGHPAVAMVTQSAVHPLTRGPASPGEPPVGMAVEPPVAGAPPLDAPPLDAPPVPAVPPVAASGTPTPCSELALHAARARVDKTKIPFR